VTADPYVALLDDLEAEQAALDADVADLDARAWSSATPADGWDVEAAIGHLAATEMWATLALTDPDGFRAELTRIGDDAERRAAEVRSGLMFRRPPPDTGVLAWWRDTRTHAMRLLRTRDRADRLPWFGPDMSCMSFATARLMETWAHGVDVRDGLGAPTVASARLRQVAELGVRTRGWSYVVRGLEPPAVDVRVELAAPDGTTWAWGDEGSAERVLGPALDFCLVVTQRRHVGDTGLEVRGAVATEWLGLAQAFAGGPTVTTPGRSVDASR
jgi:uncharacterized protein (TIGR03084 family)